MIPAVTPSTSQPKSWIKPYEFWPSWLFEFPFYLYLGVQCLRQRVSVPFLAKANYALDHGEIGIGSKFHTQQQFDQSLFLPTELMRSSFSQVDKQSFIINFADRHGYPVILKPDIGMVGKGIIKLEKDGDIASCLSKLSGDYLVQKFTPFRFECGIFYTREQGVAKITGINVKHFPTVVGNGQDSLLTLAKNHYRYTHHWATFLQYFDTAVVPVDGESVCLSFIGSHTMGCKFTDDAHLLTVALEKKLFDLFESQPGFNYGRLDVKAENEQALQRGEFIIIEVNGISSLPTHMFDPRHSIWQAYKIFFSHGKRLVSIAREHRKEPMELMSFKNILNKVKLNQRLLDQTHSDLKQQ